MKYLHGFRELVAILGGTAIGVMALAWLAKQLLTHFLSKDIEAHKARLDAQNALELEKLRSDLIQRTLEHEVKFRRVDENVAEHLAGVYSRLFRLYESVCSYVKVVEWSGEPSKDEKREIADKANREFWDYFLLNRVYLPPKLYRRTHELANKLISIANDFTDGLRGEEQGRLSSERVDHWSKAFEAVEKEATPLFTAFVCDIQKRLGVTDIDEEPIAPDVPMSTPRIEQRENATDSDSTPAVEE